LGLAVAALLPWLGQSIRRNAQVRCALDGAQINWTHAVSIISPQEGRSSFCSLACAEKWLRVSGVQPQQIRVTDEATGGELDAGLAFYVHSRVLTHAPTRERRHVFGSVAQARQHADDHRGRILQGDERPFAQWTDQDLRDSPTTARTMQRHFTSP